MGATRILSFGFPINLTQKSHHSPPPPDHDTSRLRTPNSLSPTTLEVLSTPRIVDAQTTMSFVRATSIVSRVGVRAPAYRTTPVAWTVQRAAFSQSAARKSEDAHAEETFEEFTARYDSHLRGCMWAGGCGLDGRRHLRTRGGGEPLGPKCLRGIVTLTSASND